MSKERNQVILTNAIHRKLKKFAAEAGVTMNYAIGCLLKIAEETVLNQIGVWINKYDEKDFIIRATRQPTLMIYTAFHLRLTGTLTDEEFKTLLVEPGENGQSIIDEMIKADGFKEKRSIIGKRYS